MVYAIHSCALLGLDPQPVLCEVDLANQIPSFSLVGLPSSMTQESRERVRAAVANSGFEWPARKVTINLLPANLPKWGSHFELAMALGVLGASGGEPCALNVIALGELSLSGAVRPCGWMATIAPWLKRAGETLRVSGREPLLVIAHEGDIRDLVASEEALGEACELADVVDLAGAVACLNRAVARNARASERRGGNQPEASLVPPMARLPSGLHKRQPDFSRLADVKNEPLGVVAALAAIAGSHHCLFAGPHGMGKSMLVKSICEALPPLGEKVQSERSSVLSTFGEALTGANESSGTYTRPTIHLQTSVTRAALEGSLLASGQIIPGELTRAHLGVLVADEFLELRRDVLEALRQPLEEGIVRLQRAKFRTILPARFQLLASTNLCPCGRYGLSKGASSEKSACRCMAVARHAYQMKLSGPIIDRFDLVSVVGQRCLSDVRPIDIPTDLQPLISELCEPGNWSRLLKQYEQASLEKSPNDGPSLWAHVSTSASDRGRLKLGRVARTLARLLGKPRDSRHLRLAQLLRQEPDLLFHGPIRNSLLPAAQKKAQESGRIP